MVPSTACLHKSASAHFVSLAKLLRVAQVRKRREMIWCSRARVRLAALGGSASLRGKSARKAGQCGQYRKAPASTANDSHSRNPRHQCDKKHAVKDAGSQFIRSETTVDLRVGPIGRPGAQKILPPRIEVCRLGTRDIVICVKYNDRALRCPTTPVSVCFVVAIADPIGVSHRVCIYWNSDHENT